MNARIQHLRKLLFEGTHKAYRVESLHVSILNEETKRLSPPVRKALAFEKMCELAPIFIQEGEKIVGGKTVYSLPEYYTPHEIETGNPHFETKGYSNLFGFVYNLCQDERGFGLPNSSIPAYYRFIRTGIGGMLQQAEDGLTQAQTEQQMSYYQSTSIVLRSVQKTIDRYSALAMEQGKTCRDNARKRELRRITEVLGNIRSNAPRDFYEALQLFYLFQYLIWMEGEFLIPPGRMDQYLYPYYKKDIDSGTFSEEEVFELLECMFIKLNYEIDKTHGEAGKFESDTGQSVTIGGVDPATGKDASNELTLMIMDTKLDLRLSDPRIHLRINRETPAAVWEKAAELTAAGMGFPTYDCDETIIRALMEHEEYSLEDARDYAGSGCWEIVIPGKSINRNLGDIDCLRNLEWALNDGKNVLPIREDAIGLVEGRWGLRTGNVESFDTFEDLFRAFKAQMKHNIDTVACNCNNSRFGPAPLYSALMDGCMEKGLGIEDGGCRYYETDFQMSSLSNGTDALFAIKQLVFTQKRFTLREFRDILNANYEGNEVLRQEIVNKLPKFGNGNPEVDQIADEIVRFFSREVKKHKNSFNGPYRARISSALGYVAIARGLGASADGRKCSDFYAANLSPGLGAERTGPIGVITSCGKLPTEGLAGGSILDIKFHPNALATAEQREKFIALMKTYFRFGGLQAQINVIDRKTLLDAKAHPENYPDLLVRLWGFSAYFVSLPEDYQDQIIERTELGI
ncbi:MAG: pyruvate formate lyase family protein [Eubacteriales bacterium]|nr:pyruvate formate lyase family protein [Eubacteriales bacterium]